MLGDFSRKCDCNPKKNENKCKMNQFRKAGKKENFKTLPGETEGFTNDLFICTEDIDGTKKEVPEMYKWTVKSNHENDEANNGIWNCDSDFDKEKSKALMSLHQIYFKTLKPSIEDLEKRADQYNLWPKI